MREILLNTFNGEQLNVSVVRYFEAEGKKYFVYTLNEKDAENYLRLYVGEVTFNNGAATINIISDENQWSTVKALFKGIISANRENRPVPVKDLNTDELANGTLNSYRVFKLLADIAVILGENSEVESEEQKTVEESQPTAFDNAPASEVPTSSFEPTTEPAVETPADNTPFTVPTPEPVAEPAPSQEPVNFEYEMPVPTPEVKEFAPVHQEQEAPAVEETPEADLRAVLDEAKEKIEDLMFENAELRSKIETIKLLLK